MSLYDGMGDDINIAGYKLSNIALKNTPSENPKSFKTTAEKLAKENEGKTSLIISLLDEIDTTLYVINDKLEEAPEIMMGSGMTGGVLTREGLMRMKVDELKKALKDRGLKTSGLKAQLVSRLEQFLITPENVKDFQPKPGQSEMGTQTEPYIVGPAPPSGLPTPQQPPLPPQPSEEDLKKYLELLKKYNEYRKADDFLDNQSSIDGSLLYDPNDDGTNSSISTYYDTANGGDDGSTFNPSSNARQTPSSRNDLNSNIMRLEEQVNRLSKLTKGLNKFINFSNEVEIEKLDNSYKKVGYSTNDLDEHLKEIDNIDSRFESKINSILNKIDIEYTKIKSALNGYSYTFLEGSGCNSCEGGDFWGDFGTGFKKGFDGTIDSAKKVAEFGVAAAPLLMLAAGRNEEILINHSSKKRFY